MKKKFAFSACDVNAAEAFLVLREQWFSMGRVIAVPARSEDPAGSDFLRKCMREGKLHTAFAANACTPLVGAPGVQINEITKPDKKKLGGSMSRWYRSTFLHFPGFCLTLFIFSC
ncbi:hypothetical protein ACFSMW_08520 [Virgibacillus halophilus]|uniref:Uncharacterized protein n=1 Tax=Tigheibacillus halophilus TaxID=361280 RepID=A0ABU5C5S0_9BACI|nr:hypothetical protein [Virgibacillus halophilus]